MRQASGMPVRDYLGYVEMGRSTLTETSTIPRTGALDRMKRRKPFEHEQSLFFVSQLWTHLKLLLPRVCATVHCTLKL